MARTDHEGNVPHRSDFSQQYYGAHVPENTSRANRTARKSCARFVINDENKSYYCRTEPHILFDQIGTPELKLKF